MEIICLDSVDSTNTWLADNEKSLPASVLVRAVTQSAGRGQRGNSWEAEPSKNFTGSFLFHPTDFQAQHQFHISEAVALAVVDTLSHYNISAKIKWPNDIYVGDKKICGILVEHVITGKNISRTIAGIGVNVNQEIFVSDAPNPVSMKMITGLDYNLEEFTSLLSSRLISRMENVLSLHDDLKALLYRGDGNFYPFFDRKANELISARIIDVAADGILHLLTTEGILRTFAFKEVEFII